jgi:hypothetical protein
MTLSCSMFLYHVNLLWFVCVFGVGLTQQLRCVSRSL